MIPDTKSLPLNLESELIIGNFADHRGTSTGLEAKFAPPPKIAITQVTEELTLHAITND